MMNKFVLIFLLVLVGLLSCESRELEKPVAPECHHNSTSGPLSAAQFKNFMLVQTWPPTYCMSYKCAQNPDRYTVHGLWPQNTGTGGDNELTDAILEARKTALLQWWPDLKTTDFQTSKGFWKYEYKTHGVYCTTKYSAEEYFVKALTLGEAFKTRAWLAKSNVVPDAKLQYKASAIIAAVKSYTSVTPNLQCSTIGGKSYLLEVRLCLDDALEKFINCGGKVGQCLADVYYPPAPALTEASDEIVEKGEDLVNLIYQVVRN